MSTDRRYSSEDVSRIISAAAEMQAASRQDLAHEGFSLEDLEQIATESGIQAHFIRRAALESRHPVEKPQPFVGSPLTVSTSLSLDLASGAEALQRILRRLPDIVGSSGEGSADASGLQWRSSMDARMNRGFVTEVTVEVEDNLTVVHIREPLGLTAGGIFSGLMGGLGIGAGLGIGLGVGLGALSSALFAVAVPLLFLAGSFFLSRGIYRAIVAHRERETQRIVTDIATLLEKDLDRA